MTKKSFAQPTNNCAPCPATQYNSSHKHFPSKQEYCPPVRRGFHSLPLPGDGECREWRVAVHSVVGRPETDDDDDQDEDDDEDEDEDCDDDLELESAWAEGHPFPGRNWATYIVVTLATPPPTTLALRTQTQRSWIESGIPGAPADYLLANFRAAFPSGLMIGSVSGKHLIFTNAESVMLFLPEVGPEAPLFQSEVNPSPLGNSLAGEAVALALNIEFDLHDPEFGAANVILAGLVIDDRTSPCFDMTVLTVLDLANRFLSGSRPTVPIDALRNCMSRINANFEHGTTDNGLLRAP